jgi:hypothetical protein
MLERSLAINPLFFDQFQFSFCSKRKAIHTLFDRYLSDDQLLNCLKDLPQQLEDPQPRAWQSIDWQSIDPEQIIGIDRDVFLSIIIGALDTEAPIRGYTQTSRQYLAKIQPNLARFVGGVVDDEGNLIELGLWEKEERQHTPALLKIYSKLTGEKIFPKLPRVRQYQPTENAANDLYRHGLHRTLTEYGAVCLYLYLVTHTTGALQQVFTEILQDEINHMIKFWGFGLWLYPNSSRQRLQQIIWQKMTEKIGFYKTLDRGNIKTADFFNTFQHMTSILNWNSWTNLHKIEFIYISIVTLFYFWQWSKKLPEKYLDTLLGQPDLAR